MIEKLIAFSLSHRLLVSAATLAVIAAGIMAMLNLPVDSFPDVSNVQVQIITEPESMATEEVEALVTYPIENVLNGLPKVKKIRSSSSFGLSVVTAIFDDDTDVYFARNLIQQRLTSLSGMLPEHCPQPTLGPVISSFSQVYMYYLTSSHHDLTELRTIQDWDISRRLRSVPGVANVATFGGFVKQYQVIVNPRELHGYKVTLNELVSSISQNNDNAGGNFIEQSGEEVIIRGMGRIKSVEDIRNIVLKEVNGTPVTVGQVSRVVVGQAFRRGSASMNGDGEAVTGIVYTRKGVNTKAVVERVKEKVEEISHSLGSDVRMVAYYDQTELVDKTIETVKEILIFSGGLVIVVLTAILLHIPSALIVSIIIPLSLLFSFILMKYSGLTANLMTLGAVDFGIIVDAGVVLVENIFRHLARAHKEYGDNFDRLEVIKTASVHVAKPIVFSIGIIMSVYLPLFALEGVEGKMFHPLALTFMYALAGSLLASLTVIPVLCFWVMRGPVKERENPALTFVADRYLPLLNTAVANPKKILGVAVVALALSLAVFPWLGSEFIPSLDEGPILVRMKMPASISHTNSIGTVNNIERMLKTFPEVAVVVSRTGRAVTGPGLDGVDSTDTYISLHPKSKWTTARTKEQLVDMMAAKLHEIPGLMFSFSQPIADMVDDLIAGIRADLGIKIFGDDLKTLAGLAAKIESEVSKVQGAADMQHEHLLGLPELNIELKRPVLARFGLNTDDVLDIIRVALAGDRVTELGSFVAEAQSRVARNVHIPKGYKIIWSGQFENQERAMKRLSIVVPVVLVLIFVLLFASFNSFKNAGLIMLNVPFAMSGGILALFLSHQTLSVPAIIGFIALFGVAVQNGVIMVTYIMQLEQRGASIEEAVIRGAQTRLRPVLMTALVAVVGLLPKVLFQGTGTEVQRPLATVILGGLVTATALTLIVLPALYKMLNQGKGKKEKAA